MSAPMVGMGMDCPPPQGGLVTPHLYRVGWTLPASTGWVEPPLFLPVFVMRAFVFRAQWHGDRNGVMSTSVRRRDVHSGDSFRRG